MEKMHYRHMQQEKQSPTRSDPIMHETVRLIRDILLRTFLISLIIALLIVGIYYGGRHYWDNIMVVRLALINQESLNVVVVGFFVLIRFYLIFILLAPALALHWTLKRLNH
jgi:hypothetical protein